MTFANSCLLELRTWLYDLPAELRIDRADANQFPQAYLLHMVYHTSFILLMKPFLESRRGKEQPQEAPPRDDAKEDNLMAARAVEVCYEAARQICLVSRKYRQVFGGFQKSPISATHCTLSAALIFLGAQKRDPARMSHYHGIEACLKNLEELSTSWDIAKRFLESLRILSNERGHRKKGVPSPNNQHASISNNSNEYPELGQTEHAASGVRSADGSGWVDQEFGLDISFQHEAMAAEDHGAMQQVPVDLIWQDLENGFMFDPLLPDDYISFSAQT